MSSKAKTHKGRKILEARQPQVVENQKKTLFIKGTKTKEKTSNFMKELVNKLILQSVQKYTLKKKDSLFLNKSKLDVKPFEGTSKLQYLCDKNECAIFAFGLQTLSNKFNTSCDQKKRPNNLVIGRIYDNNILDMVEFGIENYESLKSKLSQVKIPLFSRPALSFQGDVFEYDVNFMRIKNLFIDFFTTNMQMTTVDVNKALTHIISFSTNEEKIFMRVYQITKNASDTDEFSLQELGPNCDLTIRRHQFATDDVFKQACKQYKPKKKKEQKNIYRDALGDKMGKVYIEQQNLNALGLKKRKVKKVKLNSGEEKKKEESQPQQ